MHGVPASALAARATYEPGIKRSTSDVAFSFFTIRRLDVHHNSRIPGPASDRGPGASHGPVCLRVQPVCQHRSVLHPFGTPTCAINQTMPATAVEVSYTPLTCTQPNNMSHNASFSLQHHTENYYHIGSRSLIIFFSNVWYSHFQRQQLEYYGTASWVPYHKHYLVRDTINSLVRSKGSLHRTNELV